MNRPEPRHRALAWAGAAGSAALALVWTQVVPAKADAATGWQWAAISLGHPVCWALLACAAAAYARGAPRRLVSALAWSALGAYAAFLTGLAWPTG